MTAEIVPIHEGPSLRDIVSQLRALADRIEKGEEGEVTTLFAVMPIAGDYPRVFGWGDIGQTNDPVVQFELAKLWLLTNMVEPK